MKPNLPTGQRSRQILRWLEHEQTVNDKLLHPERFAPLDDRSNSVDEELRPEHRPIWPQQVLFVPASDARAYGLASRAVRQLGVRPPRGHLPIFIHAQPTGHQNRITASQGAATTDLLATPTASYRTVLVWGEARSPIMLKLSLGAVVARARRALTEQEIVRALILSRVLETIPGSYRDKLRFDWFPERAGIVHAESGQGWMMREFPASAGERSMLVPAFSLYSARGDRPPLLIDWARGSRIEDLVIERVLSPYVAMTAHLLLEQGIEIEGHAQNVLFEVRRGELSGRILLRDLADAGVNVALRLAKNRPLPRLPKGFLSSGIPFSAIGAAVDLRARRRALLARRTVEGFGFAGFVWPINESLKRWVPRYDADRVNQAYFDLWQQATARYLHVRPMPYANRPGLPIDEAILRFLERTDWTDAHQARRAPSDAGKLLPGRGPRRNQVTGCVSSEWGELFLAGARPAFFRPAF